MPSKPAASARVATSARSGAKPCRTKVKGFTALIGTEQSVDDTRGRDDRLRQRRRQVRPIDQLRGVDLPPAAPMSHDGLDARWAGDAVDDRHLVVDRHIHICNAMMFYDILIDIR